MIRHKFLLLAGIVLSTGQSALMASDGTAEINTGTTAWMLFLTSAGLGLVSELAGEYAYYTFFTNPDALPGGDIATWLTTWVWAPGTAAVLIFYIHYFFYSFICFLNIHMPGCLQ